MRDIQLEKEVCTIEMTISCIDSARYKLNQLMEINGIDYFNRFKSRQYLVICKELLAQYRTTNRFKVGDKVYVHPSSSFTLLENCIRATITDISENNGYLLRAFKQDLPGIYMFNVYDYQLELRVGKSIKKIDNK